MNLLTENNKLLQAEEKLKLYRKIWNHLHSDVFQQQSFEKQLEDFEHIISTQLNFCKCGSDSQFIISFMLKYYHNINLNFGDANNIKKFWCVFHNFIRYKLNQSIDIKF